MKSLYNLLTLLVGIGLTAPTVVIAQDHQHHDPVAAVKALEDAFVAAVNSGDGDKFAEFYWNSPDLVSFNPEAMELRGYEAVVASWKGFLESTPGVEISLHDQKHIVAGEYVVTHGMFTMKFPTPDDGVYEMKGRYTDLIGQQDGKWVFMHDHASAPLPPPPASEE